MRRAFIFANGKLEQPPVILKELDPADLIIAADGGALHCAELGIKPGVIIGDFDSLQPEAIETYKGAGVEIIQFPSHKDETDLELALQHARKKNAQQVYILGGLGARWDMSLANILLLAHPSFIGMQISLLDGRQEIRILSSGEQSDLPGYPGETISLIPLAGDAEGITTQGLEYPLNHETLYFGSSRGVSNVFVQNHAKIQLDKGILACIFTRRVEIA